MKKLILFLLIFTTQTLIPITVGSTSAVIRNSSTPAFPVDAENVISGFLGMDSGFSLDTGGATCTFNSFMPVFGDISLNGGTLNLARDLILQGDTEIKSLGSIVGFGSQKMLDLAPTISALYGPATFPAYLTQKSSYLSGQEVWGLDWMFDDNYLVTIGRGGDNQEIKVFSVSSTGVLNLVAYYDTNSDIYDVACHPNDYLIAVAAKSNSQAVINSSEVFVMRFNPAGPALTFVEGKDIGADANCVAWSSDGNYLAAATKHVTNNLIVYSMNSSGSFVSTVDTDPVAGATPGMHSLAWSPSNNYLVMGEGLSLYVYSFNGTVLTQVNSLVMAGTVGGISYRSSGNLIATALAAGTNRLNVVYFNGTTLSSAVSVNVGASIVNDVFWSLDGSRLVLGQDTLTGGSELKFFCFNSSNTTLNLTSNKEINQKVRTVGFSHNGKFVASGESDGKYVKTWDITDFYKFENIYLNLNNNLDLQKSVTFKGGCGINGNNSILNLINGVIVVTDSKGLKLENIYLNNVQSNRFYCVDNSATVTLQNCVLALSDDLVWPIANLEIYGTVKVQGSHKFVLQNSGGLKLGSDSELIFECSTTFSYDPQTANRDLFVMADSSSILTLNNATLYSTTTGLRLTNGTLRLKNLPSIYAEGLLPTEGISFGNGIAENNLNFEFRSNFICDGFILSDNV